MAVDSTSIVPIRTPLYDRGNNLTRPWVSFFSRPVGLPLAIIDVTLSAVTTTIVAPTVSTAIDLEVIIRQDATGGRLVTWDASLPVPGSVGVDSVANSVSTFRFVYSPVTNTWVLTEARSGPNGLLYGTQSSLAALAALLTTTDAGLLVCVTDYAHVLVWNGTAWAWGPGESGSGYLAPFAVAPTGSGWHVCDGSTVNYLKADGTTGSVTLPNTAGSSAFLKLGPAYSATITAAVVPTISGHTEVAATGDSVSTGSALADTGGGTTGSFLTGASLSAATHQHNLTSANAPITLPGNPMANFPAPLYFRQ